MWISDRLVDISCEDKLWPLSPPVITRSVGLLQLASLSGLYETIPPWEEEAPRLPTPDLTGFSPLHVFCPPQLHGRAFAIWCHHYPLPIGIGDHFLPSDPSNPTTPDMLMYVLHIPFHIHTSHTGMHHTHTHNTHTWTHAHTELLPINAIDLSFILTS